MNGVNITQYNTVAGIVQFEPTERKTPNGSEVRDVVVQAIGSGGKNVKVTIWPEYSSVELDKGTFVVANGKYTEDVVNGTTYRNLSANVLLTLPTHEKEDVDNVLPDDDEEELLF